MKKTFLFFLLMLASFSFATVKAQAANEADEIINKHIAAIGGAEKLRQINTVIIEGALTVQGMEIALKISTKNNYGRRLDVSAMGMDNYEIIRTDSGWRFFPIMQQTTVEPITADELKLNQKDLDQQSDLLDYQAKGHTVEYLGKEDADGTECYKIKINYKWGSSVTYFIDPASYYIVQSKSIASANGQEIEIVVKMSDYKKTDEGYVFPYTLEMPQGPLTISKITINQSLENSLFTVTK